MNSDSSVSFCVQPAEETENDKAVLNSATESEVRSLFFVFVVCCLLFFRTLLRCLLSFHFDPTSPPARLVVEIGSTHSSFTLLGKCFHAGCTRIGWFGAERTCGALQDAGLYWTFIAIVLVLWFSLVYDGLGSKAEVVVFFRLVQSRDQSFTVERRQ